MIAKLTQGCLSSYGRNMRSAPTAYAKKISPRSLTKAAGRCFWRGRAYLPNRFFVVLVVGWLVDNALGGELFEDLLRAWIAHT